MNEHSHIEDIAGRIRPRTASNILLWIVGAFFVAFFAWASLTELDRTVKGGGRIIASSHLQVISNLEGGVVEAILVRTGQQVAAGQQ
jgi:adhesin transport system membrane fusion protein